MRVALYGATGRAGSRILAELQRRGHQVVAVTRHGQTASSSVGTTWATDDLSQVTRLQTRFVEPMRW
jgi:uncharacterized protein